MEIKSIFISVKQGLPIKQLFAKLLPDIKVYMIEEGMEKLPHTDAYIGFEPVLDFFDQKYKWVHSLAAGVDRFVGSQSFHKETILTRTIDQFGYQIGTYCLNYMLSIEHRTFEFYDLQRENKWQRLNKSTLENKRVVIFGTGQIGTGIAKIMKSLNLDTVGVSRSGHQSEYFDQVYPVSKYQIALKDADWVISILPLTSETENFFDDEFFSHMNGANFINVGRGLTVNESDLLAAIEAGQVGKAILDVQRTEPLPNDSPLYNNPNIIITPHISGRIDFNLAAKQIYTTFKKIANKEQLHNQVDLSSQY